MRAIFELLDGAPQTAHVRELRAKARTFELAVKHSPAQPPANPQLEAMFELVSDLHAKAVEAGDRSGRTAEEPAMRAARAKSKGASPEC